MSNNFSRTLRALRADGLTGWALRALLAALLLGVWAVWFFLGGITLWAVSDSARAEVREDVYSVDAPVDGRVLEVYMERGQRVAEGDLLVELESEQQESRRQAVEAELEGLLSQRQDLETRIASEKHAFELWLVASQSSVNEALAEVDVAQSAAEQAAREESRARDSDRDEVISKAELERAIFEREQKDAQVASARAAASRARNEREVEKAERANKIEGMEGELAVLEADIRRLNAKSKESVEELDRRQIRAPASGELARVAELRSGTVVEAGQELARIIPSGRIGAVAWYEPAEAVGRIANGQQARMRLDAFPSTQFGTIPARVVVVESETTDGRIRVDLDLEEQPINIQLQHGMPGRVEVEVDRLSPAALLMRAVGKLLDQPAQDRGTSLSQAGSPD